MAKCRVVLGLDVGKSTGIALFNVGTGRIIGSRTLHNMGALNVALNTIHDSYEVVLVAVEYPIHIAISKYNALTVQAEIIVSTFVTVNDIDYLRITPAEWKSSSLRHYYKDGMNNHENDAGCIAYYGYLKWLREKGE